MPRPSYDERGVTLIEVLVASVLGLLVLIMGYAILGTSTRTAATISSRAVNTANARVALTDLEANLRFAYSATVASPGGVTTLTVLNATGCNNVTQPSSASWTITANGLVETTSAGSTTVMPNVTAVGTGFTVYTTLRDLVRVNFSVNSEKFPVAADAVTVNDLVAPDNVGTAQSTATTPKCT